MTGPTVEASRETTGATTALVSGEPAAAQAGPAAAQAGPAAAQAGPAAAQAGPAAVGRPGPAVRDDPTNRSAAGPGGAGSATVEAAGRQSLSGTDAGPGAGAATGKRSIPPAVDEVVRSTRDTPARSAVVVRDPEQALAAYRWRLDPETLREVVDRPDDLRAVRDALTAKLGSAGDNAARARLLGLRAVVSRLLGELDAALTDGQLGLRHAEATGEQRRIAIAQARLAHVLQCRGEYAAADRLFAAANSPDLPDRLRSTMHEHAGRSCYEQGRYIEACNHFEAAVQLRGPTDADLATRTGQAWDAICAGVARDGWGPYARTPQEVSQEHRPPTPAFDERRHRWGYLSVDGTWAIGAGYVDAQPFSDGVAWVRGPHAPTWELVDETGRTLVASSAGYRAVRPFSDGVGWVSPAGTGNWFAIDTANRVAVPGRFDDVRPFRRGIAVVRRGGWGAVDRSGRLVVPMRYTGFATVLSDGRYLDGFTDDGLAVVETPGGKGVVDRTGRVVVPTEHANVIIHPVAVLIGARTGGWGALDRRGEPLIDPVHRSRADVVARINRLLADTEPVL